MGQFEQDWLELGRRVACQPPLPALQEPPTPPGSPGRLCAGDDDYDQDDAQPEPVTGSTTMTGRA